ncbi:unnamed protein product [Thelazia callipaeda]|uniref:C-CAP/cofactor C-like domain-containing protein n=1 Tax=Thelazia callipaeda TaxID=103827 RepID=A0A158RCA9_THECL|nr:unnamed protein product [Thelazia callipaeda]
MPTSLILERGERCRVISGYPSQYIKVAKLMACRVGECWMSHLHQTLIQKPLISIAIPGSHDSFTQTLFDKYPVANDQGRFIRELGRFRFVRRFIRRWSRTQQYSVTEQLYAGIRYFDIRLTVPLFSELDGIRVLHALYGDRIEHFLLHINEFLVSHYREVVILDFNHLYNFDRTAYASLFVMLQSVFGKKLCPQPDDIMKLSLAYMWESGYQVITIAAVDLTSQQCISWIWDSSSIISPYANVDRIDRLFAFLDKTLRDHRKSAKNTFFVTQAILTAKWIDILLHPFSTLERLYATKCTKEAIVWLSNFDEPKYFNIIICDFIDCFDFCNAVISLNTSRTKNFLNDINRTYRDKKKSDPAEYRFINHYGDNVIKSDGHIAGEQFVIDKCKECCILLLDHLATVNIDDCEDCLIVTGPCKGSVFIRDCKNISLFTICQQFRTRDCIDIDISLFCATRPIIESSKFIRFRSLALFYEKLEEHMMKASLSPFDCDTIKKLDMLANIEIVKFNPELSSLPSYTPQNEVTAKKMLILCTQQKDETLASFYSRILKILRQISTLGAQLITTNDIIVKKGELRPLFTSRKLAKISGHLIMIEVAWNRRHAQECFQEMNDTIELIHDDDNFKHYRAYLYRFVQMQVDK